MGFSVSASTAIIFAGLFLAFGMLYPAVSNSYERVQDAEFDRDDAQLDRQNTAIEITELTQDKITVTNTGSTSLTVSTIDLLINNTYQDREPTLRSVEGNSATDLWLPGERLTISFESEIVSGDRVTVATEHGLRVSQEFL
jgi:flagellar protein FlaF